MEISFKVPRCVTLPVSALFLIGTKLGNFHCLEALLKGICTWTKKWVGGLRWQGVIKRKILPPSALSNSNKYVPQMLWSESNASLLYYDFPFFSTDAFPMHFPQNDLRKGELKNNLVAMKDLMSCSRSVCWHRRMNLGLLLEGQFSYSPPYTVGRCTKMITATSIISNEISIRHLVCSLASICLCFVHPQFYSCEDWCHILVRSIINWGWEFWVLCKCVMTLKRTRTAGPSRNTLASTFDTAIILDGLFS